MLKYFASVNVNSHYIRGDNLNVDFASFIVFSPCNHHACNFMEVSKQILTKEQVIESISKHKTVWKVYKGIYFTTAVNLIILCFGSCIYFGGLLRVQPQCCWER